VKGWSCGLKTAQTTCVSGIPDGVKFHVGEDIDGPVTCFCAEELCNVENFCDGCVAGSGKEGLVGTIFIGLVMLITLRFF